ncbi:MAG: mechanosensitive ion channel domain-containing protein [Cyanobacteria bacterium P01_H01_bin.15]
MQSNGFIVILWFSVGWFLWQLSFMVAGIIWSIFCELSISRFPNTSKVESNVDKESPINATKLIIQTLIIIGIGIRIFPYLPGYGGLFLPAIASLSLLVFGWSGSAAIADIIPGLILVFGKNLYKDQWIRINGNYGKLIEQNLIYHKLETLSGTVITIPNKEVFSSILVNYGKPNETLSIAELVAIMIEIHLSYPEYPEIVRKVENKLKEDVVNEANSQLNNKLKSADSSTIGKDSHDGNKDFLITLDTKNTSGDQKNNNAIDVNIEDVRPAVYIKKLDESVIIYELKVYTNRPDKIPLITSEIHKSIIYILSEVDGINLDNSKIEVDASFGFSIPPLFKIRRS